MYLIASLLFGFIVTIFLLSKIAEMLHAKKPDIAHVFIASLLGSVAAVVSLFAIGLFAKGTVDPMILLIMTISIMFIVSSMAFKYINVMNWGAAFTTNIANIVLSLITLTASVVLTGGSFNEAINSVTHTVKQTNGIAESVSKGEFDEVGISDDGLLQDGQIAQDTEEFINEEEVEPLIKEIDLLPKGTVNEINAAAKKVSVEPKYRVISIGNIRSAVGKSIRILNSNGKSISGSLKIVRGNDAVIEQRLAGGVATTPISLAKIRKLEVYR